MKAATAGIVSFGATGVIGSALIAVWLTGGMAYDISPRLPGPRPPYADQQSVPEKIDGELMTFDANVPEIRGAWPGFRGPTREGISDDLTELASTWPAGGPPALWKRQVGAGYSGCAVLDGRVFFQDYDPAKRREIARCISLADGRDVWAYGYKLRVKYYHGYSRTVPAVTDEHLVMMGAKCHVTCFDPKTGQLRWAKSLVHEYGTKVPEWYAGQCPLIDDGKAILAPCGNVVEETDANGQAVTRGRSVLMTAIDCATGAVAWEVPNPHGWRMTHSSIAVMELEDYTRMYVYCASGGVTAVSAADGKVLWELTAWQVPMANVPMPVPIEGNRLLLVGGYNAGCRMVQVVKDGERYVPQELWARAQSVFGSQQQTPLYYKGHIFGTRPDQQFVCLSTRGEVVWASGAAERFGKDGGPYLLSDDKVFLMDDDGLLTLLEATPRAFTVLGRAKVLPGMRSWAPMALVAGRLLARDETLLVCFDMAKKKES